YAITEQSESADLTNFGGMRSYQRAQSGCRDLPRAKPATRIALYELQNDLRSARRAVRALEANELVAAARVVGEPHVVLRQKRPNELGDDAPELHPVVDVRVHDDLGRLELAGGDAHVDVFLRDLVI